MRNAYRAARGIRYEESMKLRQVGQEQGRARS